MIPAISGSSSSPELVALRPFTDLQEQRQVDDAAEHREADDQHHRRR